MPREDGKNLEKLVAEIERIAVNSGGTVEVNKRLYDDAGIQVAEFDILITFQADNSQWLIECRNRPSEGAAPVSWIEQLIGRKILHQLDRVIAVSTTGFSSGAIQGAKKGEVELRTVTENEIPQRWLFNEVPVFNRTGTLSECVLVFPKDIDQDLLKSIIQRIPSNVDDIAIYLEKQNIYRSPKELFQSVYFDENNGIYEDLEPGQSKHVQITCIPDATSVGCFLLELENSKTKLESIELFGEVRIEIRKVPFDRIEVYKQNGQEDFLGQRMSLPFEVGEEAMKLYLYDVQVENGRQIAVKIDKILKEENQAS